MLENGEITVDVLHVLAHLFKEKIGLSLGEYARLQVRRDGRKRSARATATDRKIASA